MAAELIGYIYAIDVRLSYVKKNGETLILNPGSHITSHTDAEIIAAPVPINITYTMGDTAFKCMYVPKSYLDKQTHVPASIFLKEASNVRDLVTNTKNELRDLISPFMSIPVIANNHQSITLPEAFDKPHIVMVYPFEPIQKLIVNNIDHSYYGDPPTNLSPGLYQLYTFGSENNYHFSIVPLGEYFKGSDGKPYSIADKINSSQTENGRSLAEVFASEIGSQSIYTWLRNRVRNANFSGLRIGDYIDVPITAGANVPAQTVRYRIGAIDQYYQCGDTAMGHHIVMVPRAPVSVTGDKASSVSYIQWRSENDNNGTANEKHPYLVSKLHDWELNDFLPALPSDLQAAIMVQRVLLEERYSSSGKLTEASGWSWTDLGKIWSPSEMEVYGCPVWGSKGYSVGFDSQFPIFTDTASRTVRSQISWWLRSVVGGSSSSACCVDSYGYADSHEPAYRWLRPLPCFLIG